MRPLRRHEPVWARGVRSAGGAPDRIREAYQREISQYDKVPGFLRVAVGEEILLIIPIPTTRPASLLAVPHADSPPFAILQHIATVAALELERMWLAREELRRLGGETLAQLLEGRLIQGTVAALERLGVSNRTLVMLIMRHADPDQLADLHNVLADFQLPNLLLSVGNLLYAVVPGDEETIVDIRSLLPDQIYIGVSAPFDDPTQAPTAAQQAKWALGATSADQRIARHGKTTPLYGPRSREEAQVTVDQVLGAIIEYDRQNETDLVHSLRVFLDSNRSWKQAAETLFVHKQTLIYRMRRVEELTGQRLNNTSDVVHLWLALRAYEIID